MKLTRNEAIDRTIELWTWLAETGKGKFNWPQWICNEGVYREVEVGCFLCEFARQSGNDGTCKICPYKKAYGILCDDDGEPYVKWCDAKQSRTRKKYAKEFLSKIIALKEEK